VVGRKERVFLGLLDLGGYNAGLEAGMRTLGCKVFHLNLASKGGWFRASGNRHPVADLYGFSHRRFHGSRGLSGYNPVRYFWTGLQMSSLAILLIWICLRFDIIILKSGIGFTTSLVDLKLFRFARKKLVFLFLGSDSRPPYLIGHWGTDAISAQRLVQWTRSIRDAVDRVSPYADVIFDNPLSAHFQTRPCFVIQALGCIVEPEKLHAVPSAASASGRGVRVIHAPSLAEVKGTAILRMVIERLRSRGYQIEYVELQGRSNQEVMAELQACDLVVDDLYCDSYGGMLALEAAVYAKPVLVSGYGKDALERFVPEEARMPVVYAREEEFEEIFRYILDDEQERRRLGGLCGAYAHGWAQPHQVAKRLLRAIEGSAPASWKFDPFAIDYCDGVGGTRADVRAAIRKVLDAGGPDALCLPEKPALRDLLIAYAFNSVEATTNAAAL
jgi:glycosyltransferase involved in cell wall biosynthesis